MTEIVVDRWREYAANRQSIVFTASVAQAKATAEAFVAAGVKAAFVSGATPADERADILKRYSAGDLQVVANCQVLTEGFDAPSTSAVLMVCPTKSDLQYVQKLGRGLRTAPGKDDCLVLDFAPIEDRDVVMAGDVLGRPRQVAKAEAAANKAGVLTAFGVDLFGHAATIDPTTLIVKVLNLLKRDMLAWTLDGVHATATLKADETLTVILPDASRIAAAEAQRAAGDWSPAKAALLKYLSAFRLYRVNGKAAFVGMYPTFEAAKERADLIALDGLDRTLAKRKSAWRGQPPTDKQVALAARMKIDVAGMDRGAVAQMITHTIAVSAAKKKDQRIAAGAMKQEATS